jgi:hypothetical protein
MIEINKSIYIRGEKVTITLDPPRMGEQRVGVALEGDGAVFDFTMLERVHSGYYISSNRDPRIDMPDVTSATIYRSLSDAPAYGWPTWTPTFVGQGGWLNLVLELKAYQSVGGQTFTVEGITYTVPAPDATIQLRNGSPRAWGYPAVLAGRCDGLLHRALQSFRNIPESAKVNIQLASEVDTDNEFGVTWENEPTVVSMTRADRWAVSAYRYIINWFRQPPGGIEPIGKNVTFSMGWAGQWSGRDRFVACHPDTLPVDYCHWNIYNHGEDWSATDRLMETELFRPIGSRIAKLPILVAEWGANKNHAGGQAGYISEWPGALMQVNERLAQEERGQYVMTNYFSSRDSSWGLLDPKDTGIASLQAAYAQRPFTI